MYDNFTKALNHFITKQIVADHDQKASFEKICDKLAQEKIEISEVCCELIKWVEAFVNDHHARGLQFDFEGNPDAEKILREILIQFIPDTYFSIYAYVELEEYKKREQKKLHVNVIDEIQFVILHKKIPDFFMYVREVVKVTGKRDRLGRYVIGPEERDLLEGLGGIVKQYNKAVGATAAVTAFFAQKGRGGKAQDAPEQLQTVKLFA